MFVETESHAWYGIWQLSDIFHIFQYFQLFLDIFDFAPIDIFQQFPILSEFPIYSDTFVIFFGIFKYSPIIRKLLQRRVDVSELSVITLTTSWLLLKRLLINMFDEQRVGEEMLHFPVENNWPYKIVNISKKIFHITCCVIGLLGSISRLSPPTAGAWVTW